VGGIFGIAFNKVLDDLDGARDFYDL